MLNDFIPKEFLLGEIYLPPLLISVVLAFILASMTMSLISKFNLLRYLAWPAIVELSFAVIYTVLLSFFVIPS
ncbi:DUF1656 domain-containing protein [Motilimonas sp. KMU-193]|uniref:DUF1656 domain-containing protein n=1 Tax=Motilimonas sp. KMU-193 TaxID=3388668 RepID=UPI00396B35FD